jgi:DNA-3-methyladenine glycosylase II
MSQQLSTKVADIIHGRFLALYGGRIPKPEAILATPDATLRGIGLSGAKLQYVKNVAQFELDSGMGLSRLRKMDDEEIIQYLTAIRGVGRWTVEMLLIFALGREDVFAVDDLGIQTAMAALYRLDRTNPKLLKQRMQLKAENWRPYRSYACRYLWAWKDDPAFP